MRRFLSLLLLVTAVCGIALARAHTRIYYSGPEEIADSVAVVDVDSAAPALRGDARVAMRQLRERQGLSEGGWSMSLAGVEGDTLSISLRWGNSDYGSILDERYALLTVARGGEELFSRRYTDTFATSQGCYNTLSVEIDNAAMTIGVSGGSRQPKHLCDLSLAEPFHAFSVRVGVEGKAKISLLSAETSGEEAPRPMADWSMETLKSHLVGSTDPLEGFYRWLDRTNDPDYALPGGRYSVAVVRAGEGYDLIYLDGAQTNASRWRPFMLKGRLMPTIFAGHYDLEWVDPMFETITEDVFADFDGSAILTLSFPLYKTVFRFAKEPVR